VSDRPAIPTVTLASLHERAFAAARVGDADFCFSLGFGRSKARVGLMTRAGFSSRIS